MTRYIDAEKLAEYITTNYCKNCDIYDGEKCRSCLMDDALNFIETFQTADVVPKSEVERLQEEANRYKRYYFRHDYDEMIAEVLDKLDRFINANCIEIKDERGIKGYVTSSVHFAIAELKKKHLKGDGAITPHRATKGDFTFEYGIVTYKHRFSINRSLDDYEETTLSKCIRMGIEYKYKTAGCDKLIAEMQLVYKDENDKLQCLCLDLHEYTFEIKHKGNMRITL